jgi:DNA invertase Pin-like site-specific DNA recombinase
MNTRTTHQPAAAVTAVYTRISKDRQEGKGVERQAEDCIALAKRRGWPLAGKYEDNDVSASRYTRRRRPQFRALMHEVSEGRVNRIVCWKFDRLYRQPKELEALIDLAEAGRVEIVTVMGGDIDLNTSQGRTMARVSVAMAAGASDDTSERIISQKRQRRAAGLPNGATAVGWKDGMHQHPAEAARLNAAYDMVLAGSSLNDIARRWSADKVRGRANWTSGDISDMLKLARHAGLMAHAGEILATPAKWKPIVARAKWEAACAVIATRSNGSGLPRRRSLLTGLVTCGKCGSVMIRTSKGHRQMVIWRCNSGPGKPGCGTVSANAPKLEALLIEATFQYVDGIDLAALVGQHGAQSEKSTIARELAKLDQLEADMGEAVAAGRVKVIAMEAFTRRAETQRSALRAKLAHETQSDALAPFAGRAGALRATWTTLSTDQQRGIIREALRAIKVLPRGRSTGGRFDATRVVIGEPRKARRTS